MIIFCRGSRPIEARDKCAEKMDWRYGGENDFLIFKCSVKDLNTNFGRHALPPYE